MKLTKWYPAHIKPAREGLYQQLCGLGKEIGYQRWDGKYWSYWFKTIKEAQNAQCHLSSSDKWRGLAQKP